MLRLGRRKTPFGVAWIFRHRDGIGIEIQQLPKLHFARAGDLLQRGEFDVIFSAGLDRLIMLVLQARALGERFLAKSEIFSDCSHPLEQALSRFGDHARA